jgi:hypothetical protein
VFIDTRYVTALNVTFCCGLLISILINSAYEFELSHTKRSICISLNVIVYLYSTLSCIHLFYDGLGEVETCCRYVNVGMQVTRCIRTNKYILLK